MAKKLLASIRQRLNVTTATREVTLLENAGYQGIRGIEIEMLHEVPPPYTRNYMPSRPDLSFAGLDDSVHKTNMSETITNVPRNESTASKSSKDSLEQPKEVRPSAPIIEEQVENLRKSQSPRVDKRNWNGLMTQKLGDGFEFNKKACFVCGSLNHLIKDCNFYENKMVGKSMLNNMGRVTGQKEVRPVWNNAQRVNHQNKLTYPHPKRNFVPIAVATKYGLVPVNAAKQSSTRATTSISTAMHVNTAASKPRVNVASPIKYSYFKAHLPLRRPFNQKSAAKTNNFNKKVYTTEVNNVTIAGPEVVVSTAKGKRKNVVKSSACWIWRPTGKIFDNGCSRYMTGNKSYLTDYQDIDEGFVDLLAFVGSPKGENHWRQIINVGQLEQEKSLWIMNTYCLPTHAFYSPISQVLRHRYKDADEVSKVELDNLLVQPERRISNKPLTEIVLLRLFVRYCWGPLLIASMKILLQEPKKVIQAMDDPSWIEAMQEELLQFKLQKVNLNWAIITPRDSPFDLEAFSDSHYAGASLDRKSTTRGCQFLRKRLISWQCKKQTIIANSTTEIEYVDAVNCCGQMRLSLRSGKSRMERAATTASSLKAEQDSVDFLNSTHIKYALTKNPTIYVSLIHQFWQTTSASTSENGDMKITATIDGRVKTVTEASIRRHLKLEDSNGISTLPNTEIFEQLALMGDEGSMTLHELTVLCTTLSKKVESLESDLKQTKLTYGAAYTKLIMKVKKLENRIKSSKARRRVRLIVSEDEGDLEDPSKQGRKIAQLDEDEGITLVQMGAQTQGRHEHDLEPDFEFTAPEEVYTAEPDISTANVPVSTAGAEVSTASPEVKTAAESLVYIRRSATKRKDKGKAIMKEAEPVQKKTKLQLEQERLGYEEALRLQEQLDEEERQRIARVHEEANTFNAEE
ncbi:hypothetical protein Tco_0466246 [Tanacetum coccineum]